MTFLAAGDYEGAYAAYDCLVQADETNDEALMRRGLVSLMFGPSQAAFDDIDNADINAPELMDSLWTEFDETLANTPDDLFALTSRAYLLWLNALDEEALADYDAILEIDADNVTALLLRGSSNQYMGNVEDAATDFSRIADQVAENPAALSVIAYSYIDTADNETGLAYLNQLLALQPDDIGYLSTRAQVLGRLGDIEAATADMARVISLDPDNAVNHEDLGWLLLRAAEYGEAILAFDTALAMDSTLQYSVLGRATSETALGDTAIGAASYAEYVDMVELESLAGQLVDGAAVVEMYEGTVYRIPLSLNAGQTVDIAAVSADTSVDPLLVVLSPDGTPVIGNDDVDERTGDYNAGVSGFEAAETGLYTLVVTHSGSGSVGPVDVTVTGLETPSLSPTKVK